MADIRGGFRARHNGKYRPILLVFPPLSAITAPQSFRLVRSSHFSLCRTLRSSHFLLCSTQSARLSNAHSPGLSSSLLGIFILQLRKLYDYIRYDLKEIAFPSSLPNPPNLKKRRKLNWEQRIWVLKRATRLYAASWVRDIGPDLRPNDYKTDEVTDEPNAIKKTTKDKEPSMLEDLAVAARGGMETLRPALQRVYMTRASAYRDAMKSFIEGYQEGVQQVMEKKENSKTEEDADTSKKST